MLYLIYGQDSYRVQEKLTQIKIKFVEKTGSDLSIATFNENATFEQIKNEAQFSNFLAPQKLIILKKFLSQGRIEEQKKLVGFLKKVPSTVYLVFVDSEIKASPIVKRIKEMGKVWQFEPLEYYNLTNWIRKRIEDKKRQVDPEAVKTLAFFVGNNLARLSNEIDKLISYCGRKKILADDVKELVKPEFSPRIFDLIDKIAVKDLKQSQNILKQLLDSGENPLYIHTMIVYQFRNLIIVKFLTPSGLRTPEIRAKTRLHPFVIQKSLAQIENFSLEGLKKIYARLLDAEVAIKTGRIEPELALELLVPALLG